MQEHFQNKFSVFYHLPFSFMETNSKMGLLQHLLCLVSINCFLLFICLHIFGKLFKILLPLAFSITLSNSYYFYLFWEDIVNDLNRIEDFLINLWNSFQMFVSEFYKCFGYVFWQFTVGANNSFYDFKLNCKYIYMI